jgi:hypothetical protein
VYFYQGLVDAAKRQLLGNREALQQLQRQAGLEELGDSDDTVSSFTNAVAQWEQSVGLQQSGV